MTTRSLPQQTSIPTNQSIHARNGEPQRPKDIFPFGYHNAFHTHAVDALPPSYHEAKHSPFQQHIQTAVENEGLPLYSCSIHQASNVHLMIEFRDPFMEAPFNGLWQRVHALLEGTKLSIYWIKSQFSTRRTVTRTGKKIAQFSMQHAEVGLAVDVQSEEDTPRNAVLSILPSHFKNVLKKTRPHLFEKHKEWILRLRVEGYQVLMSFDVEKEMLDWCERICESIDIAAPLEDRTEPRYRSLPRRSRRQRQLENHFRTERALVTMDSLSSRLVEQQERIMCTYYPNLASDRNHRTLTSGSEGQVASIDRIAGRDLDLDELDAAEVNDFRENINETDEDDAQTRDYDPKTRITSEPTSLDSELRYRRRCLPIMYKFSPRSSEIIFCKGARWRIDYKKGVLRPFEMGPPRYPRVKRMTAVGIHPQPHIVPEAVNMWRQETNHSPPEDDGSTPYRVISRSSGRAQQTDFSSMHIGPRSHMTDSHDSELLSTRVFLRPLDPRDENVDSALSPGLSILSLKEKNAPLLHRREVDHRHPDETVHTLTRIVS